MIEIERRWAERFWAEIEAVPCEELTEAEAMRRVIRITMVHVADFLANAVVQQFMHELTGPAFAQMRWKARQRLVRLIARRGRGQAGR